MCDSKKGRVLDQRAREIINNVDKYFEGEKQRAIILLDQIKQARILAGPDEEIHISPDFYEILTQTLQTATKVTERVTLSTGVNKNTVTRIRHEASTGKLETPKKKPRGKKIVFNDSEICALGNLINSLYMKKKGFPSLKKIYDAAKQDLNLPGSLSTLRTIMIESLGYKFKNCQGKGLVLIEIPNIHDDHANNSANDNERFNNYCQRKESVSVINTSIKNERASISINDNDKEVSDSDVDMSGNEDADLIKDKPKSDQMKLTNIVTDT